MLKQNPFSIYDFLGYLVPGSIMIYAYLLIEKFKTNPKFSVNEFTSFVNGSGLDNLFFFIIFSYTCGHLLSFSSSMSVELYANWRYSYPSKFLLDIKHPGYWRSSKHWKDVVWRVFVMVGLFPVFLFDFIMGQLLGFKKHFKKPIDKELRKLIKFKITTLLSRLGVKGVEDHKDEDAYLTDFHRIVTHYAYETSKQHQSRMSNYVALYGFLRTLCLIFNLLTWYIFLRTLLFFQFNWRNIIIMILFALVGYIFFMAFMKFYRRYTLEGFMVITVNEELK